MFGGNSNWRGPIWVSVNTLIIRALMHYFAYYGDNFKIECPTGSGKFMNLFEVAQEIVNRLARIFLRDGSGRRPVFGGSERFQRDPYWRDHLLFYVVGLIASLRPALMICSGRCWKACRTSFSRLVGRASYRPPLDPSQFGIHRESSLSRGLAEKSLRGIGKRVGELTILHELADMAIEGNANRREFGKLNVPPADLNPVIGQTRHAEHAARRFLGEPQRAAPATQGGSNAGLGVISTTEWPLLWTRAEQPSAYGRTGAHGFGPISRGAAPAQSGHLCLFPSTDFYENDSTGFALAETQRTPLRSVA